MLKNPKAIFTYIDITIIYQTIKIKIVYIYISNNNIDNIMDNQQGTYYNKDPQRLCVKYNINIYNI